MDSAPVSSKYSRHRRFISLYFFTSLIFKFLCGEAPACATPLPCPVRVHIRFVMSLKRVWQRRAFHRARPPVVTYHQHSNLGLFVLMVYKCSCVVQIFLSEVSPDTEVFFVYRASVLWMVWLPGPLVGGGRFKGV